MILLGEILMRHYEPRAKHAMEASGISRRRSIQEAKIRCRGYDEFVLALQKTLLDEYLEWGTTVT